MGHLSNASFYQKVLKLTWKSAKYTESTFLYHYKLVELCSDPVVWERHSLHTLQSALSKGLSLGKDEMQKSAQSLDHITTLQLL